MNTELRRAAIIIGAKGGIGSALVDELILDDDIDVIYAVTRNTKGISNDQRVCWLKSDDTEQSINKVAARLEHENIQLSAVYIAVGTLHDARSGRMPEKKVEDLEYISMEDVFRTNTFLPMCWIKALKRLLDRSSHTRFAILSARVGSISDNRLGGWYSYRASKAALNMMLKTLSVEFKRRYPNTKLISFHPGTTDTELSKPFQAGVPDEKLFTPNFVAHRLVKIVGQSQADGNLSFVDWDNQPIAW